MDNLPEDEGIASIWETEGQPTPDQIGLEKPEGAIEQLTNHQQQMDMDGIIVGVSRQALDEVLAYVATRPEASHIGPTAELVELVANKIRQSFNQPAPIPWADYQKMAMAAIAAVALTQEAPNA